MSDRVGVDAQRCVGAAQCELYAPEVFVVRDGLSRVLVDEPGDDLAEAVFDAADACPVQAILLSP